MTAWTVADYARADARDADQATASRSALQAEYDHGAATAWQMTERSASTGRSADSIGQRHAELNGPTADQGQQTPAESAWHRGYDAGADSSVSLLRETEQADADYQMEAG